MILNPDFREFVELLNAHEVRFLIVGGYAVAFHGHPRYTKDIDIWIDRDLRNAERLIRALVDFGFGSVGLSEEDFIKEDRVIQFGNPPNRIDLLTSLEGVEFAACYVARVTEEIEGEAIPFIDLEN